MRPATAAARVLSGVLVAVVTLAGAVDDWRIAAAQIVSQADAQTGIFGLEARGCRFIYVFDRSASMAEPDGRPLARAKEELLRSLDRLGDVQQFGIIFYNERTQLFTPAARRLAFATEDTRRAARRFVESVRAAGGTRHAEPLTAALRLAPDVIFMLTDGDEADDLTADEHARLGELLGRTRCMIVQFGGDGAVRAPRLARLATQSGGRYVVVDVTE